MMGFQGLQSVLPVGADGLPLGLSSTTGAAGGSGGSGSGGNVNVNLAAASLVCQVNLDLSTARAAQLLDLQGIKTVYSVTVRRLSGLDAADVRLHIGGVTAPALAIDEGEAREGLSVPALAVSNPGRGGLLQLEVYGGA